MKMAVFWIVATFILETYRRFGGSCCLHHQGVEETRLSERRKFVPDFTALQPGRQPYSFQVLFSSSFN
jgi:hypothetical protein